MDESRRSLWWRFYLPWWSCSRQWTLWRSRCSLSCASFGACDGGGGGGGGGGVYVSFWKCFLLSACFERSFNHRSVVVVNAKHSVDVNEHRNFIKVPQKV